MNLRQIVVAVDGSDCSLRAVDAAATLAALCGARVSAVHAVGLVEAMSSSEGSRDARREEIAARLRDVWCEPLHRAGVETDVVLRDGNPTMVVLDAVEAAGADLLVVGSRGIGGFPQMLLGSTSSHLSQHAPCPVLIVR